MNEALTTALSKLSDIQREAASWETGALLVLAGPGSGKTQVLTCRVARLLEQSRDQAFRVLALTFTNKAADEMKERIASFAPGLDDRTFVGTFHSFCGQVLRQHGVHIGIRPDFSIYGLESDRRAILEDALESARRSGEDITQDDVRELTLIDRLKTQLVLPDGAESALSQHPGASRTARVYSLYEDQLRASNALDFNSLVLEAFQLFTRFPAIAARYRRSHPYWLLDEFQDTNEAHYRLLQAMAGDAFKNVFAVADDDQIIYQWNGASFRQLQRFRSDFASHVIQLPTNFRCPPAIVEAANRLVAYNVQRSEGKQPLVAGRSAAKVPAEADLQVRIFATDAEEAAGVAEEIGARGDSAWGHVAVLGRTRALVEGVREALSQRGVPAVLAQRRDDFLSSEFRWLVAFATQVVRPLDRRNAGALVNTFNRLADIEVSEQDVIAIAESSGRGYLAAWVDATNALNPTGIARELLDKVSPVHCDARLAQAALNGIVDGFASAAAEAGGDGVDLSEDVTAWRELLREIGRHIGPGAPLEHVLQELQLRSKEPSPRPNSVTLMTVHGAKGREFDIVYVIGLAEDVLPSFQAKKRGDSSAEMEEERRNCFVAITRTKECLILSRATRYRGYAKPPSRFLKEMGLA